MAEQDPQNTPEQPEGAAPQDAQDAAAPSPEEISEAVDRSEEAAESLAQDAAKGDAPDDVNNAAADALKAAQAAIAAAKGKQDGGGTVQQPPQGAGAAQPNVAELAAEAVSLPDFNGASSSSASSRDIDLLADVNLNVTIELGRTRMLVEDVLRLGEGSVVELDKLAGDPVDVFVNGRHVARGEVLVVNDNFCVRVSEILSRTPGSDD